MSDPSLGGFPLLDLDDVLAPTAIRIAGRFRGVFSRETAGRCLFESYPQLSRTARIRRHLPLEALGVWDSEVMQAYPKP